MDREYIENQIDELKELLTDIINESERDDLSLRKSEILDQMYFEIESKIQELEV